MKQNDEGQEQMRHHEQERGIDSSDVTTINICKGQPIPEGWVIVQETGEPNCPDIPDNPNNAWAIRRLPT